MPVYASSRHYYSQTRDAYKGAALAAGLLMMVLLFFAMALSSGPIILGTELNANGSVEYLCAGSGCEDFSDMHWSDK
jgi:hypothetical protein